MSRWKYYNPNPTGRTTVGDCAVRTVSAALGVDWEEAFSLLAENAFNMGDMPSADSVIGSVLRQNGYYRMAIPNDCPDCYTAEDFARENPEGTFVLGFGGHVATIKNGLVWDSWDSTREIPQYVWYRKDGR